MIQGYFNEFACLIFALPDDRTMEGCRWRQWFPQWNCRRPQGKALPDLLPWQLPTRICHRHLHGRTPEQKHFCKNRMGLEFKSYFVGGNLTSFLINSELGSLLIGLLDDRVLDETIGAFVVISGLDLGINFYLERVIIFGWWGLALITGLPFGAPSSTLG